MAYAIKIEFLRTITGILKVIEMCIVLVILLIARFGGDFGVTAWCTGVSLNIHKIPSHTINVTGVSLAYLGIGSTVGFAIIVPAILLTYLLGANPSILEFIINIMGGILFISTGSNVAMCEDSIHQSVGSLSIILGIVFLADLVYLSVKTKCGITKELIENKSTEISNQPTVGTLHI